MRRHGLIFSFAASTASVVSLIDILNIVGDNVHLCAPHLLVSYQHISIFPRLVLQHFSRTLSFFFNSPRLLSDANSVPRLFPQFGLLEWVFRSSVPLRFVPLCPVPLPCLPLRSKITSGGERRRVALCKLLLRRPGEQAIHVIFTSSHICNFSSPLFSGQIADAIISVDCFSSCFSSISTSCFHACDRHTDKYSLDCFPGATVRHAAWRAIAD